jgi:hypothetical protein
LGRLLAKRAGSQNRIIHQYAPKLANISCGKIPKTAATKKPTLPESQRKAGDQNLKSVSEIIHSPIDNPNRSRVGGVAPDEIVSEYAGLVDSGELSAAGLAKLVADNEINTTNIDLIGLSSTGVEYLIG